MSLFQDWQIIRELSGSYIVLFGLVLRITILAEVVLLIVLLIECVLNLLVIELFVGQGLAGKPVDSTRDELLLDILAQLVVDLEALLDVGSRIFVFLCGRLGRGEEVEE